MLASDNPYYMFDYTGRSRSDSNVSLKSNSAESTLSLISEDSEADIVTPSIIATSSQLLAGKGCFNCEDQYLA